MTKIARIHSIETCGTVDGPGIRYIVFFQGCLMRCLYCHNRDTWAIDEGNEVDVPTLMNELLSYRHYMKASGGGVTASGGEPILQAGFIKHWFKACHEHKIHTCLDTNGFMKKHTLDIDELLDVTDLVMLDLKQLNPEKHHDLIGVTNKWTLEFADLLTQRQQRTWIRHVVVPGYTDAEEDLLLLGEFVKGRTNIEYLDLLPYHAMGKHKWEQFKDSYQLENVQTPTRAELDRIKAILSPYVNVRG